MKTLLPVPHMWKYLFSTLIFWGIAFTGISQCGGPSFPASAEILSNVPEASAYNLVYDLAIPTANQSWMSQADITYAVNNSAAIGSSPFTRVAYYLKLESSSLGVQWVWVSMNAFSSDLGSISIPTGDIMFQQTVTGMNVLNYAGVNRTNIDGNIEFWSNCYNPDNSAAVPGASNTLSDVGDMPLPGTNCYGSFQVHDFNAGETLLAYNGWAYPGFAADDLGIGNCSFCTNPDWTTAGNANFYTVKELYVFVNAPSFQPVCNSVTLNLDPAGNATLTPDMVTTATVGSCGVSDIQLSKTSFNCSNTGNNTVTVTFTVNGNTSVCNASVSVLDNTAPVITTGGPAVTIGCNPSTAAINAAFGTATATDNCGTPALTFTTSAITLVGNTYSQTRTWTATDGTNSSSASRTVSWPKDIVAPVITATGTATALGCNPSAAAIEAALGTATATDNCGTPTLSVSTASVVASGNNRSQTRTWTATDGSNSSSVSRTATWTVNCSVNTPHTFASSVSCDEFNDGAEPLLNVCYKADNRKVKKVSPKQFYYYTKVTAPSALGPNNSFYVDIIQTKSCSGFNLYSIQGNQVRAYDNRCRNESNGQEISEGQGRVRITGAAAGRVYTISVKYETKSLKGSVFTGNTPPVCENSFVAKITLGAFGTGSIVPASQGIIKAMPDCYDDHGNNDDDDDDEDDDHHHRPGSTQPVVTSVINTTGLSVIAAPNPSAAYFSLILKSNTNDPIIVRVTDLLGQPVYLSDKITANSTLHFGDTWRAGSYFAVITQGSERKMIRLVKQ